MVDPLEWEVLRDSEGREARVRVRGEIDLTAREALLEAIGEATAGPGEEVVLDLREVTFVDSSGLAALLDAAKEARGAGRAVALEAPAGGEANLLIQLTGTAKTLGLRRAAS